MITTYKQAQSYLDSFIDYEKKSNFSYQRCFKSQRMNSLVKTLNINHKKLKALHIAGTKGKGSTAWLSAYMLAGSGHKVGVYTSPHLYDFRERIQIVDGKSKSKISKRLIPKKDVTKTVNELQQALRRRPLPQSLGAVSFFEVYTAIALMYFLKEKVDFAVIETGLGGRLDATNILKPLVSIITHIGYDHTEQLGKSLPAIAREKAGIIKNKTSVVCSNQNKAVIREIETVAAVRRAPLFTARRDFHISRLRLNPRTTLFDYSFKQTKIRDVSLRLRGACQVENAACALTALCLLKEKKIIKADAFHVHADSCLVGGRFQTLSQSPLVVVDVAHNPSSFKVLKENIDYYYPGLKKILVFGCSSDKNFSSMLSIFKPQELILTRFENPRAADPHVIRASIKDHRAVVCENISQALSRAWALYSRGSIIVVSGSLYLVARALPVLKDRLKNKNLSIA